MSAETSGVSHLVGRSLVLGSPTKRKPSAAFGSAARGSQEAAAIYRSMKAEPIRQENARRAEEMARWEEERAQYWATHPQWTPSWTAPSSPYNPTPTGPSVSQILDNSAFNQMINYYSGGTSVCPSYNRYC